MKNKLTEIVFIIDKSGSMKGLEKQTVGGINDLIKKQKKKKGEVIISTVFFNEDSVVIHDRVNIKEISKIKKKFYNCSGMTALLDAVGSCISYISKLHKSFSKEFVPDKTLFVIVTDGYENSSFRYSYYDIQKLIAKHKKRGWEFLFLGANINAEEEAEKFGIEKRFAAQYHADKVGTKLNYEVLSKTITHFRKTSSVGDAKWKKEIEQDYMSRK